MKTTTLKRARGTKQRSKGKRVKARRTSSMDGNYDGNMLVAAFAGRLKKWRQAEGKTLKEVAAALEMSIAIVSEWENGYRFPSIASLVVISEYTGIPAWKFLKPEE